ncbi:mitochondrial carrier with solute carrier repeats [Auriculariales sp. MPI-PUGE-AT-0066]|nr:mitochondrial carrier with solute carrier repeats [Auriculariales sp. MPI-PUGE-AT-0066]
MSNTLKDLTAGTAGGIAQVLVGQPFDICKVRMQTAPAGTYQGLLHCAGDIIKNEGPLAFYKGTLSPLLGIGACVSIQFGVLEAAKRHFASQNAAAGFARPTDFTASQLLVSPTSIVSGPVEHIRIRLQTQKGNGADRLYQGPGDAVRKIAKAHGLAGLYKGQVPTLWREASGYAVYFLTYEKLVQRDIRIGQQTREDYSRGLLWRDCGYALWAVIYPIDVVKSRIQTDGFGDKDGRKYSGMLDCVRKVWKAEGAQGFLRGLGPTVIRSPFANGATFLGFELASRALSNL